MRFGFLRFCYYLFLSRSFRCEMLWMESWGLRGGALKHLSDAVLESVMVFRLAAGARGGGSCPTRPRESGLPVVVFVLEVGLQQQTNKQYS